MIARNQKVLQQGVPQVDIAILRTDYDYPSYGRIFTDQDFMEKNNLMNDTATFWKDLSLQAAGYSYDYFSSLLLTDETNIRVGQGQLQPDGAAYQAIIVYQERIDLAAAEKLLVMGQAGVPVVFVNQVVESTKNGRDTVHKLAASKTLSAGDDDAELAKVVAAIKALPTSSTLDRQEDTLNALQTLGVEPRVAFAQPNKTILTQTRLDAANQRLYVYAYNYKFAQQAQPYSFELVVQAEGKPYRLNDWTGEVSELGVYQQAAGKTQLPVTLQPGESTIVILDLAESEARHPVSTDAEQLMGKDGDWLVQSTQSGRYQVSFSDGSTQTVRLTVPAAIPLTDWHLSLEDWNKGARQVIVETQLSHTTEEVYYETAKTTLEFELVELVPWKDLPASAEQLALLDNPKGSSMADVSGVGHYRTHFVWDGQASGAWLALNSVNGNSVAVYVNGQKAAPVNLRTLKVDISELLVEGDNTLEIEVASTLVNRLRTFDVWAEAWNAPFGNPMGFPEVQDYG